MADIFDEAIEKINNETEEKNTDGWTYYLGGETKRIILKALKLGKLYKERWQLEVETTNYQVGKIIMSNMEYTRLVRRYDENKKQIEVLENE